MKTQLSNTAVTFPNEEQSIQNRKILRYRSCLAYASIVCTNLKHLKADLLSVSMCEKMGRHIKEYIDFRVSIQEEIRGQELLQKNVADRYKQQVWSSPIQGLRSNLRQRRPGLQGNPTRFHFLATVYSYAEGLLSDVHMLNYEHLSDSIYEVLGQIILTQMQFRNEIQNEREMQSQRKTGKLVYSSN